MSTITSELGLTIAAFCTTFGSLVDPHARSKFLLDLVESAAVARRLGCRNLITQVGATLPDVSESAQIETMIEGLRQCVPILQRAGVIVLIEPLNTVDHPGYFLTKSSVAFEICAQVASPHVQVLYDIYHQQVTEGNLIATIARNIQHIGHFHAAGTPGRAELYGGEIDYPTVLRAIADTGFTGHVGLEYFPHEPPVMSLSNTRQRVFNQVSG